MVSMSEVETLVARMVAEATGGVKKQDNWKKKQEEKKTENTEKTALPIDATAMVAEMKKMVLETVQSAITQHIRPPIAIYNPQVCESTPAQQQQAGGGPQPQPQAPGTWSQQQPAGVWHHQPAIWTPAPSSS